MNKHNWQNCIKHLYYQYDNEKKNSFILCILAFKLHILAKYLTY